MSGVKPLVIGDVKLENNLILAPMAGVTDLPFRMLCKQQGAGMVCTEMVSSRALYHHDEKTKKLLHTKAGEQPIQVQIFGNNPEIMARAAKEVCKTADIIDLNMGCPAPKIVKNGDGSRLLLDLDLATKIAKAVVDAVDKPVTVKMRKGWEEGHFVAVELAQRLEQVGVSAVTVHGRTKEEYYHGVADYESIRKVKEAVSIPVIGNGDVTDGVSAKRMLEETKVDGIMIGRATFGNPWIFREILQYLNTGEELPKPTLIEKLETMKQHIAWEVEEKGEDVAIKEMRKQMAWYTKNLKEATKIRQTINTLTKQEEMVQVITEYFASIGI